jgi:hypothetical protein
VTRFVGYGFDVREADLRAGRRFRRTFTGRDGHEYVVTLGWIEQHGCPHVSQYRADLMERLLAKLPEESA